MGISEKDRQEMRSAICYAVTQYHIANALIKAALGIDAEWWPEFKRRDFPQESDLEKIGEVEGYILAAMRHLARARKMITVIKTKQFEIEEASYEQRNNAD